MEKTFESTYYATTFAVLTYSKFPPRKSKFSTNFSQDQETTTRLTKYITVNFRRFRAEPKQNLLGNGGNGISWSDGLCVTSELVNNKNRSNIM